MQGSILTSSGTFFAVILAHFYYKNDRLSWKKLFGLIAGFAGIVVANWGQDFQLSFYWMGEGFLILSGVTSAVATIMAKELAAGIHPFALTGWQLTIGAVLMLLVGVPQLGENAMTFTPFGWGLLIYSAFLSAAAFALWYSLLKYNKAGEISIYKFMTPVFGALLSALFIPGESLNIYIVLAIVLCLPASLPSITADVPGSGGQTAESRISKRSFPEARNGRERRGRNIVFLNFRCLNKGGLFGICAFSMKAALVRKALFVRISLPSPVPKIPLKNGLFKTLRNLRRPRRRLLHRMSPAMMNLTFSGCFRRRFPH